MSSIIAPACVPIITKNRPYLFEMAELDHRLNYGPSHLSYRPQVPDLRIIDQDMVTTVLTDRADNSDTGNGKHTFLFYFLAPS